MISGVEIENRVRDPDLAPFKSDFSSVSYDLITWYRTTGVQNLTILASAIPGISLGSKI